VKARVFGGLLALLVLGASTYLMRVGRPLEYVGGLTDEWFPIGCNLAVHQTMGLGKEPIVLRPPGYPAFIAIVLSVTTRVPAAIGLEYLQEAARPVLLVQAVLLAATAVLIFAWLTPRVGVRGALVAAALYGLNPYSLLLPGLLHYDVLHHFITVAGCIALDRSLSASRPFIPLAGAGALWGVATLVRSVTLPLPVFVLGMIVARGYRGRRALAAAVTFAAGMAVTVAPWTARNYRVTGRLIPVNLQGWAAIWGSTVAPLRLDPNEFQWAGLAETQMQPIFRRATGADYAYSAYVRNNVAVEEAFKQAALENLAARPGIYAWNVVRGFVSLSFQINTSLVSVYQRVQRTREAPSQSWFWAGQGAERRETLASSAFGVLVGALTILAVAGLALGIARGDHFLLVPGLVCACMVLAHAVTFVDVMYYYLKVPFLVVFAAVGLEAVRERGTWLIRGRHIAVAGLLEASLVALAVGSAAAVVFTAARNASP